MSGSSTAVSVVKLLGCYVRVYADAQLITNDEYIKMIDFQRNCMQRYFDEVAYSLDNNDGDSTTPPPSHPMVSSVLGTVSLFNHTARLLRLLGTPNDKASAPGVGCFFAAWPHAQLLCDKYRVDAGLLLSAIGLDADITSKKQRLANNRREWVKLLHEMSDRFSGCAGFVLASDFVRMAERLQLPAAQPSQYEQVFCSFMQAVHARLTTLNDVLHRVQIGAQLKK